MRRPQCDVRHVREGLGKKGISPMSAPILTPKSLLTTTEAPPSEWWPGIAQRKWNGDLVKVKAEIVAVFESGRIVHAKPKPKFFGFFDSKTLVPLIGDSYPYVCEGCGLSPCGFTVQKYCSIEQLRKRGLTFEQATGGPRCPRCFSPLAPMKPGDKVLLHYRYAPDKSWAHWFAERWDWV